MTAPPLDVRLMNATASVLFGILAVLLLAALAWWAVRHPLFALGGITVVVSEGSIAIAVAGGAPVVTIDGARVEAWSVQILSRNDRLAIALLGGGQTGMAIEKRERATSRRRYREYLAERRAEAAQRKAKTEANRAAHQAIYDRLEAEKNAPKPSAPPRIRRL